jgi:alkanesulfonate monooxygenase SsuD/methylene tetrahydromethanopterin reductase-like flavin-dependent oxidoreductase (luciferase family)
MIEVAVKCENLGFDSIWMVDHLEMRPPISYESQPIPECWSAISALASTTRKMKIGSLVSCSLFRNPNYLSSVCKTVNEVSHGRLIAGVGSGWFDEEFRDYGIPFLSTSERLSKTEESVVALRKTGDRESFPIWVGGSGEKSTLKLVAKYADGCSFFGDPLTIRHKLEILEKHCRSTGRDLNRITRSKHSNVVIAETVNGVHSKLRRIIPDESKWGAFIANNIVGSPDECFVQAKKFVELGVNYLTLTFPDVFENGALDVFSNEVMRKMR